MAEKQIDEFLQILEDMERHGEKRRIISGAIDGPFLSKAVYSCTIRIGFEDGGEG